MRSPLSAAFFAAVALFFLAAPTTSAQSVRVSIDELAKASDAVIVGRTLRSESFWTADRTAIMTRIVIRVDDQLAGTSGAEREIIVPGGQVGEYLHEVSDMPVFTVNEDVVVFVQRHASGVDIVTGGAQGKLEIVRDAETGARVVRGAAHLLRDELDDVSAAPAMDNEIEEKVVVPLDVLRRKISGRQ